MEIGKPKRGKKAPEEHLEKEVLMSVGEVSEIDFTTAMREGAIQRVQRKEARRRRRSRKEKPRQGGEIHSQALVQFSAAASQMQLFLLQLGKRTQRGGEDQDQSESSSRARGEGGRTASGRGKETARCGDRELKKEERSRGKAGGVRD